MDVYVQIPNRPDSRSYVGTVSADKCAAEILTELGLTDRAILAEKRKQKGETIFLIVAI